MHKPLPTPFERILALIIGNFSPPSGGRRIMVALLYGFVCHAIFAVAVIAMIVVMYTGMTISMGRVPVPWSWATNLLLVLQFPIGHSLLLSRTGRRIISLFAKNAHAATLQTTIFATLASVQLSLLFLFWTPSGFVWWAAEGETKWVLTGLYACSWALLMKASYDAGAEVQSGALGWMSLLQKIKPNYPDMPKTGLFAIIRQPIYLSFALTLWTVPVWTPDQLVLSTILTAYCVLAPRFKERRFEARFGAEFEHYRTKTPYMVPRISGSNRD